MTEFLKSGDKIGPYEIIQVIEGGMGIVYLVNDPYREPPNAITPNLLVLKTLKNKYLYNERTRARFVREAETWIKLMQNAPNDVNVVKAYRVEEFYKRPYIVMEFVGPSLRYWLKMIGDRMGSAAMIESMKLAIQICYGMDYLESQVRGFVHRDLKPENALVRHDQSFDIDVKRIVKITDLGLAKALHEYQDADAEPQTGSRSQQSLSTKTGVALGTAYYMSPEQRIDAKSAHSTSDIYSFGIMLFEMLTVAREDTESIQWRNLMQRLAVELPKNRQLTPRTMNPHVPEEFDRVVMKCLEKVPEDRYPNFSSLRVALTKAMSALGYDEEPAPFRMNSDRSDWDILFDKATSLSNLGRYNEAKDYLDEAIRLHPNIPEPWVNKGLLLLYQDQLDAASECFNRALEIDPKHPHALTCKGMYFERTGNPTEAIKYYDLALQADSEFVDPLVNKGGILSNFGRFEDALEALDRALKLQSKDERALQFKGITLEKMGRCAEALVYFERALAIDPMNAATLYEMGLCYSYLDKFDQAEQCYLKSVEINPSPDTFFNITICALKQAEILRAIHYIDKALELRPSYTRAKKLKEYCISLVNPDIYLNEAIKAMDRKDFAKAIDYLDTVLAMRPSDATAGEMRQICLHFIGSS